MVRHQEYPEIEQERGPEYEHLRIKDVKGEALTEQRTGVGAQTRWYYKFYSINTKWDDIVIEWDEERKISWEATSGWRMIDSFTLSPNNGTTKVTYYMDYTPPLGILGKFIFRLFFRKHMERNLEYTLLQMKRNTERLVKVFGRK